MAKFKDTLHVKTDTDQYELTGRTCELSAFSFIPKERQEPKERTFFNSDKKERYAHSTYDRLFHQDYGFNNKIHRCDRDHAKSKGLTVNDEECTKKIPTLSSSVYGHRITSQLDPPGRDHVRIAHVQSEFYRRNGINVKPPQTIADY